MGDDCLFHHYLSQSEHWQSELTSLRRILLSSRLVEVFKWGNPCYTINEKNVVILGRLKECCTLSFFKGALLADPQKLLELPGKNTRLPRVIRLRNQEQITAIKSDLEALITEAILLETQPKATNCLPKPNTEIPLEFQRELNLDAELRSSFEALTPGRQRGYLLHFAAAKQSETREKRVAKYRRQIISGLGIHDCSCGLSRRMPRCDGSHSTRPTNREMQ